uniref:GPI-anchored protein LLG1-like domain-containing protein n=1 Tax=Oryza punctata TaxID=4537 RepID=A0A0E0LAU4_ORYPU
MHFPSSQYYLHEPSCIVYPAKEEEEKSYALVSLSQAMADLNFVFLFFLLLSPPILSDGVLQMMGGSMNRRRSLLQAKDCPVSFENQNYTTITSKCKSPWPADLCCPALNEFACNFSQYINDESNNCAELMLTYLSAAGNYPAGLFSNECAVIHCNVSTISTNQTANGSGAPGAKDISEMYSLVTTLIVSGLAVLLFY